MGARELSLIGKAVAGLVLVGGYAVCAAMARRPLSSDEARGLVWVAVAAAIVWTPVDLSLIVRTYLRERGGGCADGTD